jgi:BirA family biotin operon repressor/biotin-[acetyl-CoA-carboxylase] ligase
MSRAPHSPLEGAGTAPRRFVEAVERVRPRLGRLNADVLYFSAVGSTNDVAAALASSVAGEGRIVLADRQTAGRGRLGRRWFSPPDSGLYVSVVVGCQDARSPERATALVTLAAGVALAEAIETTTGLRPVIKWPNDLQIGGRKVAGILAEGILTNAPAPGGFRGLSLLVLGYGINVGPMVYPPELADRATSLESALGGAVDRAAVFAESLAALDARHGDLIDGRFDVILDAWRQRAPMRRGARVSWETPTGTRAGVTEDIDPYGALLVRTDDGIERLIAGEVHWTPHAARD